jgi:hypothetical protein
MKRRAESMSEHDAAMRKAIDFIAYNPSWILGYLESIEEAHNQLRRQQGLPPSPIFRDRFTER